MEAQFSAVQRHHTVAGNAWSRSRAANPLTIVPDYSIDTCPLPRRRPGTSPAAAGHGRRPEQKTAPIAWVKARDQRTEFTLSSTRTRTRVLAAAGILDGLQATTHFSNLDELAANGPTTTVLRDVRYVDNGRRRDLGGRVRRASTWPSHGAAPAQRRRGAADRPMTSNTTTGSPADLMEIILGLTSAIGWGGADFLAGRPPPDGRLSHAVFHRSSWASSPWGCTRWRPKRLHAGPSRPSSMWRRSGGAAQHRQAQILTVPCLPRSA
ncbi:MAG: hypothetical protein IPK17_15790 [Chloroflexi bacterium]|uniref:hypothetical protein n=1 Tax=Candidatus Flexifilum breve TaxID=3140694 RepID=UPI00313576D4|nr:hypothetical protein [Chloroflexota bacterium]